MKRHIITVFCLLAAIAFYTIGAARPAILLLLVGLLFEAAFWLRIFGGAKDRKKADKERAA